MICLPSLRRFAALAIASSVLLALPAAAQANAALPSIDKFFANPKLSQVRLSPKGNYLAAVSAAPGRRDVLVVIDLAGNSAKVVAGYADADVLRFQWVNDNRLLYSVTDKQVGPGGRMEASGLFAVNRDGSLAMQLADRNGEAFVTGRQSRLDKKLLPWHTFMLGQEGAQDSEYAYVTSHDYHPSTGELQNVNLLRLNTLTGQAKTVHRPSMVKGWLLDNAGEPRLAWSGDGDKATVHYREPGSDQWRQLASYPRYIGADGAYYPRGFDGEHGLFVEANVGQDTSALHQLDLRTGKINPEALVVAKGYDFDGNLVSRRGKLLGVSLLTDAEAGIWFDPGMQALQQKVDALLPGRINLLSVPADAASPWVLVQSYADILPLTYTLYNTKTGELNRVGESYPGIDPARMGRQQPVRYKARDGREIPGLLTLPPGGAKKNLPLVVLVHGGPYVRGASWGWSADSQFLASRGYAVLEPEFRGSQGFGVSHYRAGWKQWGLAMQDDVADGARWAVSEGYADPKRICIAGASYGGYAALMGLVKDADLYQCAVSWAGVTDLRLLYGHWSFEDDLAEDYKKYGLPVLIGDREKDAAQLSATSPVDQAARVTKPVLLAYGSSDRRVPIAHGKRFRDAVAQSNKQVEWVEYSNEGHGWSLPENRIDFWGRVEKFLDKHIGQGAAK